MLFIGLKRNLIPIAMAYLLIGLSIFTVLSPNTRAMAAGVSVPIDMIYYGSHYATVDSSIVNTHPEYLVADSPAGPWKGNANISTFTSAGIKYFEYLDGGYEGSVARPIPNDLQSNLNYTNAAAAAGAYGIFLDEVSQNPSAASLNYLEQIADRAHSLGLKVVFNAGVDSWPDSLMTYCDFINSSEDWDNAPLSASQRKWASRTWLLTQDVNNATTAASLTNAAIKDGINAHYACTAYGTLSTWLDTYVALISSSIPAPSPTPSPSTKPTVTQSTTTPAPTSPTPSPTPTLSPSTKPTVTLSTTTPAPTLPTPVPTPTPSPISTPVSKTFPWIWVVVAVAGLVIIGGFVFPRGRKKR